MEQKTNLTVQANINAHIEKVWENWNNPDIVIKWNSPSPEWHTPTATNDLTPGGKFNYRMEAKDGSMGFDFWGIYDTVQENELIEYTMGDGRKASVTFTPTGDTTHVSVTFEAETENSLEMQQAGWQAILDSFKNYVEGH